MLFVIPKMFRIFVVPIGLHPPADIFIDESVLAFILEWKSGKFQWNKESNHTRHLVLVTFVAYSMLRLIRVWSIVYLFQGIPEPPFR